jgi:hypothetical protein
MLAPLLSARIDDLGRYEDTIQLSLAHRREPQVIFLGEADLRANRPEESLCDGISAGIDDRRRRDRSRSIAITACQPEMSSTWTSTDAIRI